MFAKILCFVCCLLCAVPFFIIGIYNKDSETPLGFWSGDASLKNKVKDVKNYNHEMANLYLKCAWVFLLTGVTFFVHVIIGIVLLVLECSVGIYVVYRCYKKILKKYS